MAQCFWRTLAAAIVVGNIGCSPSAPVAPTAPKPGAWGANDLLIAGIGPVAGKPTEHTALRILGNGFQPGTTVTFDGTAIPTTVESPNVLLATAPPHPVGTTAVAVARLDGQTSRLENPFTYLADFTANGDISLGAGQTVASTLDPFERTCTFDDIACRRVIIDAPADSFVEVELVSLDGREGVGVFTPVPFRAPGAFPKRLTVAGGHDVWVIGEWALFRLTTRHVK
jgi:hypothetical protein